MAEIDKKTRDELREIVGHAEHAERLKKEANIIKDSREQYTIRIPKTFAELAEINPDKDTFRFTLVPEGDPVVGEKITYRIHAELKRG